MDIASPTPLQQPACFRDLNLDQIVAQAIAPKEEYDLEPFFHQALRDEAKLLPFDDLFTHFEREETVTTERDKLEGEVFRIHEILDAAPPNSIIVINEIFASTSLTDAVALAMRVMQQIIARNCLTVCATFLDEISRLGPSVVSCTSTVSAASGHAALDQLRRRRLSSLFQGWRLTFRPTDAAGACQACIAVVVVVKSWRMI